MCLDIAKDCVAIIGRCYNKRRGTARGYHIMEHKLTWLETPGGLRILLPKAISGNGQTVVGPGVDVAGNAIGACIWQKDTGVQSLATVLHDSGVQFAGWTLDDAIDVSADGRVIVGTGKNPDGQREAWICRIR